VQLAVLFPKINISVCPFGAFYSFKNQGFYGEQNS
jgi:hypothetical protein